MCDDEVVRVYGCRWAWCRFSFADDNALKNHVVFEHVRRAIPVRRKDISILRRAEEGLGDSLKVSDIMRDPSSSLSQKSEFSKVPVSSQPQLPSSSSLPSPPTSSPLLPSDDQSIPEDVDQQAKFTDAHPTFASFSSPAGSPASFIIPTSPAFSTLIHRTNKRKEASETQHGRLNKRSKQELLSQESASAASAGSHRSVENHLTQSSGRGDDGEADDGDDSDRDTDAQGEEDVGDSQADRSRKDVVMVPPTSGTPSSSPSLALESSQQGAYSGELNWDEFYVLSSSYPSLSSSEDGRANTFLKSMSQPPSQLQLSSPLYHIHQTKLSPSQPRTPQTDPNSSVLSLPLNPVPLPSPTGFTASTPQRQTWYQPALKRRVSSRSPSGETTPKPPFPKRDSSSALPTVSEEQSQSQQSASNVQIQVPLTPRSVRESLLPKKSVFRSGTLCVTHPSASRSPSRPQFMASHTNTDEGTSSVPVLTVRDVSTEGKPGSCDTQSQFGQQSPLFEDISMSLSSFPPLQTQAPYQSQSLSQLD